MTIHRIQPRDFSGFTAGEAATFGEGVSASFGAGRLRAGFNPDERRRAEIYEPFAEFVSSWAPVQTASGVMTFSPMIEQPLPDDLIEELERQRFQPDDATLGRLLGELDARGIEAPEGIRPEAMQARREEVNARYSATFERERDVLGRSGRVAGVAASIVGNVGADFLDPGNLAVGLIGAPARVGALGFVAIEAGLNAGVEVAQTPGRNMLLREVGEEEESYLENALYGAVFGGAFAGVLRGAQRAAPVAGRAIEAVGRSAARILPAMLRRREARDAMLQATESSPDPTVQYARRLVQRDIEDEREAVANQTSAEALREHVARAQEVEAALAEGRAPAIPDRPTFAQPRGAILRGEIEEVDPRELLVQPDVFQFRSNVVAEDGQTPRLLDVTEWHSERAGIVIVYEYENGARAVADGHQRTGLARRIMDQTGQEIRVAARVFRETDGYSPEDIRVLAALKNIAEASDGMSTAMARDAARVLRVRPDAISQLPAGPGIARARALSALSDEAFDMFINEVVPERFAELVGRMVERPEHHAAMMTLLQRTRPETTAQAESILAQALQAPIEREVIEDLFGDHEISQSLYLERAKVLERAMRLLRDDQAVFRTLTERAERIEGTGENRLDAATNREIRQQVEQALVAAQRLAHRAGPISEALNDGARKYKESGRLADSARAVADAVRREIERNGLTSGAAGGSGRAAEPSRQSGAASIALDGFSDPVNGAGPRSQVRATRDALASPNPPSEPRDLPEIEQRDDMTIDMFSEQTPAGMQGLFDGVAPITPRDRLEAKVEAALGDGGGAVHDSQIGGLFDPQDPSRFDLFDMVPVGRGIDADGNEVALVRSKADLAAELDADDEAVAVLDLCFKG